MPAQTFPYAVDRTSIVPLYYQLKVCILELIKTGQLKENDCLPSESELCEKLGISRPTIRQCLNELVAEGYLSRKRGKGTFVASPHIDTRFLNKLHTFGEEMAASGMTPSSRVLFLGEVAPSEAINKQLGLDPKETLVHLRRLRFADDDPILIQDTYLSCGKYKELLTLDFARQSLYDTLDRRYGVQVRHVRRSFGACNATAKEAKLLEIKTSAALCVVTTTGFTEDDKPVEHTVSHYRGDKVRFSVELHR